MGGEGPKPPELPVEVVEAPADARNRADGSPVPDAWTASARWKRERDIPDGVLFREVETGLS